jgi:hypothetical protein
MDGSPAQVFSQPEKLHQLSLRSPQVTQLAYEMGFTEQAILGVPEMVEWLSRSYLSADTTNPGSQP